MKSFIKLSFLIILISVVFNIGLNDAYAKEASSSISKADKIETVNAVPLKCKEKENFQLAKNQMDCKPRSIILEDTTVILIFKNCDIVIFPPGQGPIIIKA